MRNVKKIGTEIKLNLIVDRKMGRIMQSVDLVLATPSTCYKSGIVLSLPRIKYEVKWQTLPQQDVMRTHSRLWHK